MATQVFLRVSVTAFSLLAYTVLRWHGATADEIAFDLPSSIECREVTSDDFAKANPHSKQIEAKVRISAWEIEGAASEIVQFDYEISTGTAIRVLDYEPKTRLESSVVADQIDITANAEDSRAGDVTAHVAYKPLLLGGSHSATAKKSEAKHFKQLAFKDVVMASGTIEREHGVFFRLRPSRSTAFEGAREFVLIAEVPHDWRADVCRISCTAKVSRQAKKCVSAATSGGSKTPVGLYLRGDAEAAASAEELRATQDLYRQLLSESEPKPGLCEAVSRGTRSVFARGDLQRQRQKIEQAGAAMNAVQERLKVLSGSSAGGE